MQKKLQIIFKDPFFYVEKYFHLFLLFNKGCTSISCALYRYFYYLIKAVQAFHVPFTAIRC